MRQPEPSRADRGMLLMSSQASGRKDLTCGKAGRRAPDRWSEDENGRELFPVSLHGPDVHLVPVQQEHTPVN